MDAVALAMVEALPATAPTVGWTTTAALTASRSAAAVSTDGTNIYVSHGYLAAVTATGATITPAGVVTAMPSASVGRQGAAGAWCNGKHYAIGGLDFQTLGSTVVETYTPAGINGASGVWSTAAGMPIARAYVAAAVIGQFIYAAGGQSNNNAGGAVTDLIRYDTVNNVWATLASMPAARTQGAMVAVGTKLYYLGGLNSSGNATGVVYVFDTAAGTWTQVNGVTVQAFAAAAVNGVIYTAYGTGNQFVTFNTTTQTASNYAFGTTVAHGSGPGMVSSGSVIYLVSGSNTANVDKLDTTAGTGYTTAVIGAKSLLDPILAGVASVLPSTPPTDTAGKATYAANVQTLKALAAL